MRISIERLEERYPSGKLPVFVFFGFFILYLILHFALELGTGICWFRAITGINCPTCGLSRSMVSLLQGRLLQSLAYNPFMLIFTLFIFLQQTSTVTLKRRLSIQSSAKERMLLGILLLLLFLGNWAYVILYV